MATKLISCCRKRDADFVDIGQGGFQAVEVYGQEFVITGLMERSVIWELYFARSSWSRKLAPL